MLLRAEIVAGKGAQTSGLVSVLRAMSDAGVHMDEHMCATHNDEKVANRDIGVRHTARQKIDGQAKTPRHVIEDRAAI
jgi:hypothetical protein